MNQKLLVLAALLLAFVQPAYTETSSKSDPTEKIAIKTDPVLQPRTSLEMPRALSGFSFKSSSLAELASFSLNFQPIIEMVALLEDRGSDVSAQIVEHGKITTLELMVDKKPLVPIVLECNDCEIVFEY